MVTAKPRPRIAGNSADISRFSVRVPIPVFEPEPPAIRFRLDVTASLFFKLGLQCFERFELAKLLDPVCFFIPIPVKSEAKIVRARCNAVSQTLALFSEPRRSRD